MGKLNVNLILLVPFLLLQCGPTQAGLTPEEQCWGQLAEIRNPDDAAPQSEFNKKYGTSLVAPMNRLVESIRSAERQGRNSTSPYKSGTLKSADLLLKRVPWNKRGYSGYTYPGPAFDKVNDRFSWQLVLGRISFLTSSDWTHHCSAVLHTDGLCPTDDPNYPGVDSWSEIYEAVHSIVREESLKNDLSKLEVFRRIANEITQEWDYFHGVNGRGSGEVVRPGDVAFGCRAKPERVERQRSFCTLFLPKLRQTLVMQLCHYKS